jgi:cell division protein FtsB
MPKTKSKKKSLTLDGFAVLIQKDLARMATKEDLKHLATKEDILHIREERATKEKLADVADRISNTKDDLQEQIAGLKYAKEIDELRERVNVLEAKLGIKHLRRAA